ncbi:MAG: rod shape-determining protein MreC, partial [Novosphingobium sp.]
MAPPNNRRSGFSKRAQFNLFYGYIAGIVGLLLGVTFLIVSLKNHDAFSGLRGVAADAAAPVGRAAAAGRDEGRGVLSSIGGFFT